VFSVFAKAIKRGIGWGAERYDAYLARVKEEQSALETPECSEEDQKQLDKLKKERIFAQMLCDLMNAFKADPQTGQFSAADVWKKLLVCGKTYLNFGAMYQEKSELENSFKQLAGQLRWRGTEPLEQAIERIRQSLEMLQVQEPEDPGAISLVCVKQTYVLDRKFTFAIGLSDSHFRNAEIDSPILSDDEKRSWLDLSAGEVILSSEREAQKKAALKNSLSSQQEGTIWYGRCFYDTVALRDCAASSFYIEAQQEYQPSKVETVGYEHIPEKGTHMRWIPDESFWSNEIQEQDEQTKESGSEDERKEKECSHFSATSLQMLLKCPQKYMFKYIEHLPELEYDQKKASTWLNPANKGNLLHRVLQEYVNEVILVQQENGVVSDKLQEDKLEEILNKWCEEYQKIAAPFVLQSAYDTQKNELKDGISRYLEQLHQELYSGAEKWRVYGTEIEFEGVKCKKTEDENGSGAEEHPIEIELKGYIDRLDYYIDENEQKCHIRIIDYKSGKKKTYGEENDNGNLVQHFIYRYAIEKIAEAILPEKNMEYVLDCARYECILDWNSKNQYGLLQIQGTDLEAGLPDTVWKQLENLFAGTINRFTDNEENCVYCSYNKICKKTLGGMVKK
jgi:hypothetical protein